MTELDDETPRRSSDELRRIARYQRWIVATVLAQLSLWAGYFLLLMMNRATHVGDGHEFPLAITFILGCVGGIYTFLIYSTVRDPFWAVVMGLACVPPFMGLLTLTVVNGTATGALKLHSVKVGLFGADLDSIVDEPGLYDEDGGW